MHPSRRRRRRSSRTSRRSSNGTTTLCLVAAVLLVAVMGVTIQSRKRDAQAAEAAPAPPPAPVVAQVAPEPAPAPRAPAPLVKAITDVVRNAEKQTKSLRAEKRGTRFTRIQTDAMAALSTARGELGAWLDEHPSDDRANKLWDRLQRVYITLKKL